MIEKIKESLEFRVNFEYSLAQGLYWMIVCCVTSFASAYLSGKGYSTASIGLILALVALIAICLQQLIASWADRTSKVNVLEILFIISIILFFFLILMTKSADKSFFTGFSYIVCAVIVTVIQPLLNASNFYIQRAGIKMNYGFARGMGSLFFFVMSLIAGNMINGISVKAAPALALIVDALFVAVIFFIIRDAKDLSSSRDKIFDPLDDSVSEELSLEYIKAFIKKYQMFFLFLIGVIGYYFGHIVVNNFMYQITVNVGGDAADNGGLLAVQAIVELPCMMGFKKLHERFGSKILLSTAAIFYLLKIIFTVLAGSVGMLYFSMLFQSLSFALFIPGTVTFVDEIMQKKDAVKGQGFVTIAMTLGQLFASVIGGLIINFASVKAALWVGVIVTLAGVVVSIYALVRINSKN